MKKIMWSLLIAAFLSSCAPVTQITGSWKNPNTNATTFNKILITALTSNTQARQTIENDLSAALEQKGYQPVKSMEILPPKFTAGKEPDKEVLLDKIKGTAVDAILTIAVLNKETENRYVGGNYGYAPIPRLDITADFGAITQPGIPLFTRTDTMRKTRYTSWRQTYTMRKQKNLSGLVNPKLIHLETSLRFPKSLLPLLCLKWKLTVSLRKELYQISIRFRKSCNFNSTFRCVRADS